VADCGSNVGNHAIFWAKICGVKKVVAFEPQEIIGDILVRNVAENGLDDVIEIMRKALGNSSGVMSVAWDCPGNNMAVEYRYDEAGNVPVTTLDSIAFGRLDFIKIDVEGGQLAVLEGAKESLKKFSPVIWLELNNHPASPNYSRENELVLPKNCWRNLGIRWWNG